MQNVFDAIRAAADSRATVMIQGESGTGKELVAKAIHFNASGDQRPLVTVNCSALSESLLESELFGHVKGVSPGAMKILMSHMWPGNVRELENASGTRQKRLGAWAKAGPWCGNS